MKTNISRLAWLIAMICASLEGFAQIEGPTTVCPDTEYTYYVESLVASDDPGISEEPEPNYNWSVSGGTMAPCFGTGASCVRVTWTNTTGIVSVSTSNGTQSKDVAIAAVTASATSNTICPGTDVELTASFSGGVFDSWEVSTNGGSSYTFSSSDINYSPALATDAIFRVKMTGPCGITYSNLVAITMQATPVSQTITGGGAYCAGGSGVSIGLGGSQSGVNYQLKRGSTNVGPAVAGTGGPFSFGTQTAAGTYTVVATSSTTGCTATMAGSKTVTILPSPASYPITGGGTYCAGDEGVSIGLADSQTGVNYQLTRDGVHVGSPVAGTNHSISFGHHTEEGTYGVIATLLSSACELSMPGEVNVQIDTPPTGGILGGAKQGYGPASGTLTLTESEGLVTKWQYRTNEDWLDLAHTSLSYGYDVSETTSYRVEVANGACGTTYSNEVTITIHDGANIDHNYIHTTVYDQPMTSAHERDGLQSITYFDGLGRPFQSIAIGGGVSGADQQNLLDWKNEWTLGSGSTPTFLMNGQESENERVMGEDPFGNSAVLWQCGNDIDDNADGGWNTTYFDIDNTAAYRYTVWVKRTHSQNGKTYHGTQNVDNLDGTPEENPYFWSGDLPSLDTWYLLVGVVHPHTHGNTDSGVSGIYDLNGTKVLDGTEFKWRADNTSTRFRSYFFYSTEEAVRQYFYHPTLQKLDGTESSMNELLEGARDPDIVTHMDYDPFGRQTKEYLPYATTSNGGNLHDDALNGVLSWYDQPKYDHTSNPYSEQALESSPLSRVEEAGSPGEDWQLGQHTVKMMYEVNENADQVIQWDFNALLTMSAALYPANELLKNTTIDEEGSYMIEFTDKMGHTVLKRSQVDASTWASTYYVYDDLGQLRVVLPPEASDRLDMEFFGQTEAEKVAFLHTWAFLYDYDGRQRMTMKKVPGADSVQMIYDQWDRLVLTRDGNQRMKNEWMFTKYDPLNRPVMTGIMASSDDASVLREAVATSLVRGEVLDDTGTHQYTNQTYPTANISSYLTVTYYDAYHFMSHEDWASAGLAYTHPTGLVQNTAVKGQITGTMTRTGDDGWIRSASYYDHKYRMIQVAGTNHLGGTEVVTNHYDFLGNLTRSTHAHNNGTSTTTITQRFVYDRMNRLLQVWHQINDEDEVQLAANDYDALGALEEKNLHSSNGLAHKQSLDYRYNVRGWLTSINDPDLSDGEDDLFGMTLHYNQMADNLNNTAMYNGNISAMEWSNQDHQNEGIQTRAYTYGYDLMNRLKAANHFENAAPTNAYSVHGLQYDLNGNIDMLQRYAENTSSLMDDLTYTYTGNQLLNVADAGDSKGFNDGHLMADEGDDYLYDANGNMIKDRNKAIDTIYYNHLNLPIAVVMHEGLDSIAYLYDAAGIKLQQVVFKEGGLVKQTDYIGAFIYENDTLQLIQHEEGRIVPLKDGHPELVSGSKTYNYQYHLKDHLGNVRLTFSTTPEHYTKSVTYEDATITTESEYFGNVDVNRVPHPDITNTGKATALNSTNAVGTFAVIKVNRRDTISLSVTGYYEGGNGYTNSMNPAFFENALETAIKSSAVLTSEGVSAAQIENGIGAALAILGVGGNTNDDVPGAYLNYLYLDKDMNLLMAENDIPRAGFIQISSAANFNQETLSLNDIIADREGYIIAYISNESNTANPVYFDDFAVYHGKTNVVQSDDYYPGGLTFNSYTSGTENKYKYNGKEKQDETGWYDYGLRQYDPELMMWHAVDPSAERYYEWSPYNYVFNNPIRLIDPDGADPEDVTNAARGYLGTIYQWGGKNPAPRYVGGFGGDVGTSIIWRNDWYGGLNFNGGHSDNTLYQTGHNNPGVYDLMGLDVPAGCSFGVDCSGLAALSFNADPDKLMGDLTSGSADDQMTQFEQAEADGTGGLHNDFGELQEGDIVFRTNKKGTAKHAMVATGNVETDDDGNVTSFEVIHAPDNGERVRVEYITKTSRHQIGHTNRTTDEEQTTN